MRDTPSPFGWKVHVLPQRRSDLWILLRAVRSKSPLLSPKGLLFLGGSHTFQSLGYWPPHFINSFNTPYVLNIYHFNFTVRLKIVSSAHEAWYHLLLPQQHGMLELNQSISQYSSVPGHFNQCNEVTLMWVSSTNSPKPTISKLYDLVCS